MKIITEFGNIYVILSIILLLYLFLKDKSKAYYSLLNIGIVIIINNIIKLIIQRPRPNGYNLINESNYSFPSGHAMIATAFYGFLIYLIYRNVTNKRIKYLLITLLFILIISICITRVYLGVHYLSDTIAGFSLSIAYLMIFITLLPKIESRLKK
jgi:undecaprenyl-diphosphatase